MAKNVGLHCKKYYIIKWLLIITHGKNLLDFKVFCDKIQYLRFPSSTRPTWNFHRNKKEIKKYEKKTFFLSRFYVIINFLK